MNILSTDFICQLLWIKAAVTTTTYYTSHFLILLPTVCRVVLLCGRSVVFYPKERHVAPITAKIGTAKGTTGAKLYCDRCRGWDSGPPNCEHFASWQYFRLVGTTPLDDLYEFVIYVLQDSHLVDLGTRETELYATTCTCRQLRFPLNYLRLFATRYEKVMLQCKMAWTSSSVLCRVWRRSHVTRRRSAESSSFICLSRLQRPSTASHECRWFNDI